METAALLGAIDEVVGRRPARGRPAAFAKASRGRGDHRNTAL